MSKKNENAFRENMALLCGFAEKKVIFEYLGETSNNRSSRLILGGLRK